MKSSKTVLCVLALAVSALFTACPMGPYGVMGIEIPVENFSVSTGCRIPVSFYEQGTYTIEAELWLNSAPLSYVGSGRVEIKITDEN